MSSHEAFVSYTSKAKGYRVPRWRKHFQPYKHHPTNQCRLLSVCARHMVLVFHAERPCAESLANGTSTGAPPACAD